MKKILTFLTLFLLFFSIAQAGTLGPGPFGAGGMLLSGWTNMGGGWFWSGSYYSNDSGSIQAYTSNEFGDLMAAAQKESVMSQVSYTGTCTGSETVSSCHPEWAEALNNCVSGTFNSSQSTCLTKDPNTQKVWPIVSVCSATNMSGACRPARVNSYGANYASSLAEQIGKAQGYNVSCKPEISGFGGIGLDVNTNLGYFYNNACTINGSTGYSAEDLSRSTNWSQLFSSSSNGTTASGTGSTGGTTGGTTGSTSGSSSQITVTAQQQTGVNLTNQYTSYINTLLNKALAQLSGLQQQLKTELANTATSVQNSISTTASSSTVPTVELTLGSDGAKSGVYSVGDTILYKVTMKDVDYVDSYYNTVPKDTCVGGSTNGEQRPWIVKAIAPLSVFNDQVESCQAGATYVISVVGTNKTSGKISVSSISVYIRPYLGTSQVGLNTQAPKINIFTVNNSKNIETQYGEGLVYSWSTSNADELKMESSYVKDPTQTTNLDNEMISVCSQYESRGIASLNPYFNTILPSNLATGKAWTHVGYVCSLGKIYTIKLTATNKTTGQSVTDTVQIKGMVSPISQNVSFQPDIPIYNYDGIARPKETNPGSPVSYILRGQITPRPSEALNTQSNWQELINARFPISSITVSSIPQSPITATVGSVKETFSEMDLWRSYEYPFTINVPANTPKDYYFIRFTFNGFDGTKKISDYSLIVK